MKKTITINGTHCNSCKFLIEDVAKDIQGIQTITVDPTNGKTDIEYNKQLNWDTFKQEIESVNPDYSVQL